MKYRQQSHRIKHTHTHKWALVIPLLFFPNEEVGGWKAHANLTLKPQRTPSRATILKFRPWQRALTTTKLE